MEQQAVYTGGSRSPIHIRDKPRIKKLTITRVNNHLLHEILQVLGIKWGCHGLSWVNLKLQWDYNDKMGMSSQT